MEIDIEKTCYLTGENIIGNIILKLNDGLQTTLSDPKVIFRIDEYHQYYHDLGLNFIQSNEQCNILKEEILFPKFKDANLLNKVKIPFKIEVPQRAYPSCYFNKSTYVKHYHIFHYLETYSFPKYILIKNFYHKNIFFILILYI